MSDNTVRQMFKQLGLGSGTFTYSLGTITNADITGEGWEYIEQATPHIPVLVNRQYIDLAGYSKDELTMFTQSVDFQNDKSPTVYAGAGLQPQVMYQYDLLTTRRIRNDELNDLQNSTPAFLNSTLDLMECVYGEQSTLFLNANITMIGAMVPTFRDSFGSGNPTASDRLHWTRIIYSIPLAMPQEEDVSLAIGSANLQVAGITSKEKDLVYIERLRRAYTQDAGRNV